MSIRQRSRLKLRDARGSTHLILSHQRRLILLLIPVLAHLPIHISFVGHIDMIKSSPFPQRRDFAPHLSVLVPSEICTKDRFSNEGGWWWRSEPVPSAFIVYVTFESAYAYAQSQSMRGRLLPSDTRVCGQPMVILMILLLQGSRAEMNGFH